jgi:hypothetical protein
MSVSDKPGKSYRVGRLRTVDLLVLTSLDQLIFILKMLFFFFTKQATTKRSTVLSLPPQLVFLDKHCSLVVSKYFIRLATGKFCYVCGSVHILWGHYGVNSNCCNQPSKTGFGKFSSKVFLNFFQFLCNNMFTLPKFLGKNIYDSVPGLCHPYLPSPPWVTQH